MLPSIRRIYIVKTVHFDETDYPYVSLFQSTTTNSSFNPSNPKSVLVDNHFLEQTLSHLNSNPPLHSSSLHDITTESSFSEDYTNSMNLDLPSPSLPSLDNNFTHNTPNQDTSPSPSPSPHQQLQPPFSSHPNSPFF